MLIIIEFRGLSVKVQFIALQFQPTGTINVTEIKLEKYRGNPNNAAFQNKTFYTLLRWL